MNFLEACDVVNQSSLIDPNNMSSKDFLYLAGCIVDFAENLKPLIDKYNVENDATKMEPATFLMKIPKGGL